MGFGELLGDGVSSPGSVYQIKGSCDSVLGTFRKFPSGSRCSSLSGKISHPASEGEQKSWEFVSVIPAGF